MPQQAAATLTNEEIVRRMAEADFNEWRWQNGDDMDAMQTGDRDGLQNFMSGYSVGFFRGCFTERGGVLTCWIDENGDTCDDASEWLERLNMAVVDEFYAA